MRNYSICGININMGKLTQKELVEEGIGSFIANVAKGTGALAGKAAKGLAKTISPTAYGLAQKAGGALKSADKAVRAATTTTDKKIEDYFKERNYRVVSINNGEAKDTKVVKVSEIVYDNTGKSTEKPINSPYVVKVTGNDVEVLRGPKKTPQGTTNQPSNSTVTSIPKETPKETVNQPDPIKPEAAEPVTSSNFKQKSKEFRASIGDTGISHDYISIKEFIKDLAKKAGKNRVAQRPDEYVSKNNVSPKNSNFYTNKELEQLATQLAKDGILQESQKKLLKHLNSGSQKNKWVIGR